MTKLATVFAAASLIGVLSTLPAQAVNSITFGANSARCGGAMLCSSDGTHGYLNNGKGQAFKASAIRKWFQIDVDGKSHLKGQSASPLRGSGSFVVVNDTGRPISKFALRIRTNGKPCAKTAPCNAFSAQGGTGAFRFTAMLASRDSHKCTQGKAMLSDICVGDPVSAAFASNNVLYSWTAKPQGAIPKGAYFTIQFSDWKTNAWAALAPVPIIIPVSMASDGKSADSDSSTWGSQTFTADGSKLVFSTTAGNLPGASTTNVTLYIYDVATANLTPVATPVPIDFQTQQENHWGLSWQSISADGSFVGYASGDPGYYRYIYEVASQTTQQVGDTTSWVANISGNGRYLVYSDQDPANPSGARVWVYDRVAETTTQMLAPDGNPPDNDGCASGGSSSDGRFIPIGCSADNIIPGISGYAIYVWNQFSNIFSPGMGSTDGSEGITLATQDGNAPITPDGRYILFASSATNLVPGGTTLHQVFEFDSQSLVTQLASSTPDGTEADYDYEQRAWGGISADGRYVVFRSLASNLTDNPGHCDPTDTGCNRDCEDYCQIYMKDLLTGDIQQISAASDGTSGNCGSSHGSVSQDGTHVVFQSCAWNLVSGWGNGDGQIYLATVQW